MLTSEAKARFLDAVGENFRIIDTRKLRGDFFFVAYDRKQALSPCEDDVNLYKLDCNGNVSIVTPRTDAERMLGVCEPATLTYEEAKAKLLANYDEAFRDEEGYTGMRVLYAWDLPDAYLFCTVEQGESEPFFDVPYDIVYKEDYKGVHCLPPFQSSEGMKEIDALLARARRIV